MVRRSRWARLITGVWALWFVAVLVEPAPLATCLMQVQMHAQSHTRMHEGTGMADMSGNASTHHGQPVDSSCMHLGACCCAPVLTAPAGSIPRLGEPPVRVARAVIPSNVASTPPAEPAHAHPFANGPPAHQV